MRIRLTLPLICFALLLCMMVAPSAAISMSVDNAQSVVADETVSITIVLDESPAGIAGYNISITLSEPGIADIVAVKMPEWATGNSSGNFPADESWVKGIDFGRKVEPGATNVPLATLTLRGEKAGSTQIVVTMVRMDDDAGYPVAVPLASGMYTVGTAGSSGSSVTSPTDSATTSAIPTGNQGSGVQPTVSAAPLQGNTSLDTSVTTIQEYSAGQKDNPGQAHQSGKPTNEEKDIFGQIIAFFKSLFGIR